jgi:UDP-N-acetyl-D-galactosamine dehydrogenase
MTGPIIHQDQAIAIVGLGYVGLPLAVAFGQRRQVIGFDIDPRRVEQLRAGQDRTLEVTTDELKQASGLRFSSDAADLRGCGVFIVTVPTPVDASKRPDMTALLGASQSVGKAMSAGAVVIYESTVYPGATEEVCVPVLERASGLRFNRDFFCGYSPERVNPGDKQHRLASILKVTSGSTPEVADAVDALYREIITAGTYRAASIRVAEAAKVIENTQRDVNIALMNELALIFGRLGIDTTQVLEAAATKWNFLPFRPGLVGGHCIGVDPYYLTHKAQEVGYHPEVILAGRRINDSMGEYVASQVVKLMLGKGCSVLNARILVLGLAFKENCPDLRNSKVVDIIAALKGYSAQVDVYDPWIDVDEATHEYSVSCLAGPPEAGGYDAVVVAVAHRQFVQMGEQGIRALGRPHATVYDVKSILPMGAADGRL